MRKRRRYPSKFKAYLGLAIVGLFLILGICYAYNSVVPVNAPASAGMQYTLQLPNWRDILFWGIPRLNDPAKQQTVSIKPEWSLRQAASEIVMFFTGVDIEDKRSLFRTQIPLLAFMKQGTPTVSAMSLPNFPKFDLKSLKPTGKPLVAIYHTHTAESFVPSSGVTHRPGGQRGDIVDVGAALAKRLESHGVATIHSRDIHDYPSFMKAYGPSEATAQKILAENASVQMIFDIHRDADKRENSLVTVNGVPAARLSIVVAIGQKDLTQPHWQQNHAFAKLIDAKLNQHFPGISRGIQMVDWRYNQHLHPRALLIEVGSHENSKEEAINSVEMLGDVLAEIITENSN